MGSGSGSGSGSGMGSGSGSGSGTGSNYGVGVVGGYVAGASSGGVTAIGVNLANNQITLAASASTPYGFVWVANTTDGTISKIDINADVEVARYRTGPGSGSPSRIAVDLNGDVWVGNQANNTLTKIGLFEAGDCVDRNNNGVIDTSAAPTDVRDWTGQWGSVTSAQDECILMNVALSAADATTPSDVSLVAVDAANNVFAGGTTSPAIFHVRGNDGTILGAVNTAQGHYGGVVDRDGFLWSTLSTTSMLERIMPDFSGSALYSIGHNGYGVTVDIDGRVWTTDNGPLFSVINPDGTGLQVFTQNGNPCCAMGITTDNNGDVYIAGSLTSSSVGHYHNDGTYVETFAVGAGPTGVAVDTNGRIWATNATGNNVSRIDPVAEAVVNTGVGTNPSDYGDLSGNLVRNITAPQGTWTVIQFCGTTCSAWSSVTWNAQTPTGTSVAVRARAASSLNALATATWLPVSNGVTLPSSGTGSLTGPLIEVEFKLVTTIAGTSPTISSVTITPWF
jgi:streptogramin lyase